MTLIERAAQAMYEDDLTDGGTPWPDLMEGYKYGYRYKARAVFTAMETAELDARTLELGAYAGELYGNCDAGAVFRAICRAALAEPIAPAA